MFPVFPIYLLKRFWRGEFIAYATIFLMRRDQGNRCRASLHESIITLDEKHMFSQENQKVSVHPS